MGDILDDPLSARNVPLSVDFRPGVSPNMLRLWGVQAPCPAGIADRRTPNRQTRPLR